MLDPYAAGLVDDVARLCVLRTEDYTLINTVYKRERNALTRQEMSNADAAPSVTAATYIRYLTGEIRKRELERCASERRWCESLREWAHSYLTQRPAPLPKVAECAESLSQQADNNSEFPSPIRSFWSTARSENDVGESFRQAYAAAIRHAYELTREDVTNTPFAQLDGSACLFDSAQAKSEQSHLSPLSHSDDANGAHALFWTGLLRVHSLFFTSSNTDVPPCTLSSSPTAILHSMHPLSDVETLPELSRSRLASSRHVWLVFFFLWCHAVGASGTTASPRPRADEAALERWLVDALLCNPAANFLDGQGQKLEALLTKVHSAFGGN
ncbi:hypothetical protein ABB37_00377 [Leptomonas pyrrhocoris]|uniref:Uncharacterized protein n=1 Tax=Leptomonas pyrrhocoris TaxID=157538 RepID=A0A0N0VHT3_LEPPY|nr:hypothetical protein ABB37_00377 [Leptomonas pyrrhocoris]XP_015664561.1 hypothetical protein ABB37_00377 [Leptomonas pyrrhocoris]KPA86121.1 hypothetical protein ABB37_00377 [Leptomonas pyrrhocoris]KPA86122.1 hypothetical protein ABB37_00377 [Leptomonas pyrrhocoris]|eukprot:XP_015664560.1 hypothetical protein ABB37_00377 [Leptomonas pyrrhocoris]